jgi:hypothetical protein
MADPRLKMQDPREQYPKPPFPKQPQPAPGFAARMEPNPDHGETSYRGSRKLTGRNALVTGADSRIGRAAAIAFAREGADVAIVYLPSEAEDAQEVIALIEAEGRKALSFPGDITDEAFCDEIVLRSVDGLGGLDILVNNAGKQATRPSIDEITSERFDRTLKTNFYAMFWITRAAQKHLEPGAAVINTASIQAQEKVRHFGERAPMGRPGQPVELAPLYVLLASQEGSFVTGEVNGVTGGEGVV